MVHTVQKGKQSDMENFCHPIIDLSDSLENEEITLSTSEGSNVTNASEIQEVTSISSSKIRNIEPISVSLSLNSTKVEITELGPSSLPDSTQYSPERLTNEIAGIVEPSNKRDEIENVNAVEVIEPDFVYMYLEKRLTEATTNEKRNSIIDHYAEDQGEHTSNTSFTSASPSSAKQKVRSPSPSPDNSGPISPYEQNETYEVLMRMSAQQRLIDKKNHLERIAEEVKVALRPYYSMRKVTKDEYKEILRRAVAKVRQSKSGQIEPSRIVFFIREYVRSVRARRGT